MPEGLFVYCIVVRGSGENEIVVAGSVHLVGSAPWRAVSDLPAASSAAHSSFAQRETEPVAAVASGCTCR